MNRLERMRHRFAGFVLIVLFIPAFSSCNINLTGVFSPYKLVSTRPEDTDIAGIWIADESTLNDMRTRGKYRETVVPKLIFHADGKFQMENMPDWWRDGFGRSTGGFQTGEGTWKLEQNRCCWTIGLLLKSHNVSTDFGLREHRSGGDPKFIIERMIGDPDSDDTMTFVRQ